ncbi:hypothetical protein [Streptomyces sp. NPDC048606]|uniref:hypothetical protein n=1 Tax=Streptomyces sp. NPDC048606 TaxID=3154726 RepID=UPI00343D11BB
MTLIAAGSVFVFISAALLSSTSDPVSVAIHLTILGFGSWLAFCGFFMGLRIDSRGITERPVGRWRTVPWCGIREINTYAQGLGPARSGAPGIVLRDGSQMSLSAIASYFDRTIQADLALLRSLHAAHIAVCAGCASQR